MTRAIVTFGVGDAEQLLDLSLPTFQRYADLHGYEILKADSLPADRPASWYKVLALAQALQDFDEALWLDADILIVDPSDDIAASVPSDAWQALTPHHTPDGEVPNHGVWLVRQPMIPVLERIWGMTDYVQHPWWEQAAGCELLGYNPWVRPMARKVNTELYAHTHFLGNEWNSHRDDEADRPRFWHASVRGDRERLMREMLERRFQTSLGHLTSTLERGNAAMTALADAARSALLSPES